MGDEALARVAAALRDGSRAMDIAARWGGDEFALLAPDTGPDEAWRLAERVRALVALGSDVTHAITVSVGVATLDAAHGVPGPEALMRDADAALYAAKRQGRNRISRRGMRARRDRPQKAKRTSATTIRFTMSPKTFCCALTLVRFVPRSVAATLPAAHLTPKLALNIV